MKFGEFLTHRGTVTKAAIRTALKSQVLYGGRLGTNLVENNALSIDDLGIHLGAFHGLETATAQDFKNMSPKARGAFDDSLAEAIPLFTEGQKLVLAFRDPPSDSLVKTIENSAQTSILAKVTPSMRFDFHLEQIYGYPRDPLRLRTSQAPGLSERRRLLEANRAKSARFSAVVPLLSEPTLPRSELVEITRSRVQDCQAQLKAAKNRDEINRAVLEFLQASFVSAATFIVRNSVAYGWGGRVDGIEKDEEIRQIQLPLDESSAFQAAVDFARPFIGAPPTAGRPVERTFWQAIGADPAPKRVAVYPISVSEQVIGFFYVGLENREANETETGALDAIRQGAVRAFSRLFDHI